MPANREAQLRNTFLTSAKNAAIYLEKVGGEHYNGLAPVVEAMTTNGVVLLGSSKRYDQDLEAATRNAMRRPFGIETNTLSPNVQLVLYPKMIYPTTEEYARDAKAEGYEVRTEGPQGMLYVLDGFQKERGQVENMSANLLFIGRMADALLNGKYPLETGERSPEFFQQVKEAFEASRKYVVTLDEARRGNLSPRIARLASLDEPGLEHEARNFVLYQAEPLKTPGIYEGSSEDVKVEPPTEAVQHGSLYLHLPDRDLPLRVADSGTKDVPASPWQEFGRNRWNRDHQLFGRYQLAEGEETLVVDFRLDSTHMPAKYGFFDTIEIAQFTPESIRQHIILGQEINSEKADLLFLQVFGARLDPEKDDTVFPVVVAGDFDFSEPTLRQQLGLLANDKSTKPDVGRVLADVLKITSSSNLQRVVPQ